VRPLRGPQHTPPVEVCGEPTLRCNHFGDEETLMRAAPRVLGVQELAKDRRPLGALKRGDSAAAWPFFADSSLPQPAQLAEIDNSRHLT